MGTQRKLVQQVYQVTMDQNLPKHIKITDRSKIRIGAIFVEIFKFRQGNQRGRLEIKSVATNGY